jgi:hypothetical protein
MKKVLLAIVLMAGLALALLDRDPSERATGNPVVSGTAPGMAADPLDQDTGISAPASAPGRASPLESGGTVRASIERRSAELRADKSLRLPPPPAPRSPDGTVDPLQCDPVSPTCFAKRDPLSADSWDEAQWMRRHGFVDAAQAAAAETWSEEVLDHRLRLGDPAATMELARRLLNEQKEHEAIVLLTDAVQGGNVLAAHRLAAIDEGRRLAYNPFPGMEWLFVARRLGDGKVTLEYIRHRYPGVEFRHIDHSMVIADRLILRYGLQNRPVERRPGFL